jgi:hypothetical protein
MYHVRSYYVFELGAVAPDGFHYFELHIREDPCLFHGVLDKEIKTVDPDKTKARIFEIKGHI